MSDTGHREPSIASSATLHAMAAVDIVSFAAPGRSDDIQLYLREALYRILQSAFTGAGIPWEQCYHEDRGDGIFILLPSTTPPLLLVDPMALKLKALVRRHNRVSSPAGNLQLRVAVHAGLVHVGEFGPSGSAVTHLFRLLDAPAFRKAVHKSDTEVGVIISDSFYDDAVLPGLGMLDPASYTPLHIRVKETRTRGWISLSDSLQKRSSNPVAPPLE